MMSNSIFQKLEDKIQSINFTAQCDGSDQPSIVGTFSSIPR